MPAKRKRRSPQPSQGLAAGERLKREKLAGRDYSAWGWVGTDVTDASRITVEHCMRAYGFIGKNNNLSCPNKYTKRQESDGSTSRRAKKAKAETAKGELADDVIIVISDKDDEEVKCTKKLCKDKPNCLNYLGQEKWESEEESWEAYREIAKLGLNPTEDSRDPSLPVGLRNLGATCYANAFLQVWFQDLAFRSGVYKCAPPPGAETKFEESPLFHLQSTFAALQEGAENVFNPVKLVESLQLRTSEQQDAQEFSKLFMHHLDSEFKKQVDSSLKTLVEDQFQGTLVYGTLCRNCMKKSEREDHFLEIEINLENNTKLEDRIEALLEPEGLTGDNKYLCSHCESLQDATRYTELRELPPILHLSLLRFVFDFTTLERKKSKQAIKYPQTLDMNRFVKNVASSSSQPKGRNTYSLRGVLQHKGSSAYHGHYEAAVMDITTGKWFQFNDEEVTEINPVIPAKNGKAEGGDKGPVKGRRKRTVEDSDIEEISPIDKKTETEKEGQRKTTSGTAYQTSKDAYMLIYARDDGVLPDLLIPSNGNTLTNVPIPTKHQNGHVVPDPPFASMQLVNKLKTSHEEACEAFQEKEKQLKQRFAETRRQVMEIYRSWDSWSSEDGLTAIAARSGLQHWLTRPLTKPPKQKKTANSDRTEDETAVADGDRASKPAAERVKEEKNGTDANPATELGPVVNGSSQDSEMIIDNSPIVCSHGNLDPEKTGAMKKLTLRACEKMSADGYSFQPRMFTVEDVCYECVRDLCAEKLYKIEHPKMTTLLNDILAEDSSIPGFWISKVWLKDWTLAQPKMHMAGIPDPPPDAPEYQSHVICEHDRLTTNMATKKAISVQAAEFLRNIFPSWNPVSFEEETCAVCEAETDILKGIKTEYRKQAEEEKAKLKSIVDIAYNGRTGALQLEVPCVAIPTTFVHDWRTWIFTPAAKPRPEAVNTEQFICEHGLLAIDPNSSTDVNKKIAYIPRDGWDILQSFYPCGPVIAVMSLGAEKSDGTPRLAHDLDVCVDCRKKRRTDWTTTEISVRVMRQNDPIPTPETWMEGEIGEQSLSARDSAGPRKSKRLRESKTTRSRLTVEKGTTVKRLKIMLQKLLDISTIAQRLFYRGHELEDNSATVEAVGIFANDTLDLVQEGEDLTILDSDDDDSRTTKKARRDEGRAFGGTLLGVSSPQRHGSSPPGDGPPPPSSSTTLSDPIPDTKACKKCTLENPMDVIMCTVCDTIF